MSGFRWLLTVLRRLILGKSLVRATVRGLLFLFSALCRATKRGSRQEPTTDDDQGHDGGNRYPLATPTSSQISASFMPTLLSSGPCSQASQDTTSHPISQAIPDSPHSSSLQHLPATLPAPVPATLSMQHLLAVPPSPNLNPKSYLPSTNSSTPSHPLSEESYSLHSSSTFYTAAATVSLQHLPPLPPSPTLGPGGYSPSINSRVEPDSERLDQPRQPSSSSSSSSSSSGVSRDIGVTSPPCLSEALPRIFPGTPETVGRYTRETINPNEPTIFSLPPPPHRICTPNSAAAWMDNLSSPQRRPIFFPRGEAGFHRRQPLR
ncbi:hypothetical protein B0H12DRAFT_617686 [Mycena haematopus]|nr:hypothetical protein B0H12DRAFT_617686 [Mycena haematopus]